MEADTACWTYYFFPKKNSNNEAIRNEFKTKISLALQHRVCLAHMYLPEFNMQLLLNELHLKTLNWTQKTHGCIKNGRDGAHWETLRTDRTIKRAKTSKGKLEKALGTAAVNSKWPFDTKGGGINCHEEAQPEQPKCIIYMQAAGKNTHTLQHIYWHSDYSRVEIIYFRSECMHTRIGITLNYLKSQSIISRCEFSFVFNNGSKFTQCESLFRIQFVQRESNCIRRLITTVILTRPGRGSFFHRREKGNEFMGLHRE